MARAEWILAASPPMANLIPTFWEVAPPPTPPSTYLLLNVYTGDTAQRQTQRAFLPDQAPSKVQACSGPT
jgi:hypothetical protein